MKFHVAAVAALGVAVLSTSAFAQQSGTVTGAAGGAVTGAVVGGPVGAAVGGVAGAIVGTVLAPPPQEVRQVVVQEQVPSVTYDQPVVVGEALPPTIILHPVPGYEAYGYTVVNNQRVIVDPKTRTVVQVVQ